MSLTMLKTSSSSYLFGLVVVALSIALLRPELSQASLQSHIDPVFALFKTAVQRPLSVARDIRARYLDDIQVNNGSGLLDTAMSGNTTSAVDTEAECEQPNSKVHIMSVAPLMVYIENFITPSERQAIVQLANPLYEKSRVATDDGDTELSEERTSTTAFLPIQDRTVDCIIKRASSLQGFHPIDHIWDIQTTRYQPGQQYKPHHDWDRDDYHGSMRVSTIFAILESTCTSQLCGTKFPRVGTAALRASPEWCEFIDCESESLVVRSIAGNALFWANMLPDGDGDENTLHAGLPVDVGHKIGLNIWSSNRPWYWDNEYVKAALESDQVLE